jgi:type I restriction enzyme S subunit
MKTILHWQISSLEDVAEIQTGLSKSSSRQGDFVLMPYLRVANVQDGHFDLSEVKEIEVPRESVKRFRVKAGDILLTEGGDFDKLGRGAVWRGEIKDCVHQNHIFVVRPNSNKLDGRFLAYQTQGPRGRSYFQSCSKQSTNLASINSTQLRQFPTLLPPLPEQRKIAEILSTWDEALEKLDALIEAKERSKKALMQQLLTGKRRFPAFSGSWKKVALGDVAENVADQNKGRMGTSSLYGVTKAEGMMPMRDHVKGESFDRCKCVETDWFAYNPMRINIGSIARWQGTKTVMVSGDYVVFRCHPHKLLPAYLNHLRQSRMWQSFVTRGGNGSVRIRIYFSDLAEFTFPCPPIDEQREIAAIFDTTDQELLLLRNQRATLDQQKRGLMQRLLSGKVRVAV